MELSYKMNFPDGTEVMTTLSGDQANDLVKWPPAGPGQGSRLRATDRALTDADREIQRLCVAELEKVKTALGS